MAHKLTVILLIVGLCLMGVIPGLAQKLYPTLDEYGKLTGKRIEKFSEAPMLKMKVTAGEIPPVEKRLPEEPMVVEPLEEIGEYGGKLRTPIMGRVEWEAVTARRSNLVGVPPDLKLENITSDIAKGWDWSKDLKILTMYLRKGLKWSDGTPFTADNILFWYNDIILNDDLTPVKPKTWSPGGELVKVEKINDYTVRFEFAAPWYPIMTILAHGAVEPFAPEHYLKEYHIKYNPKANEIAKKEDYDYWWQCFNFHNAIGNAQQDLNLPTLNIWVLKTIDAYQNKYYERNPYYWKIDTVGNQLPYVDEQNVIQVENEEVINLKAIAGEFSYVGKSLKLGNYPLYKKGEKKGNYRIMLWKWPRGSETAYLFNYTHKDAVLKKIFNDIRWRQAMSLAINRQEINNILFFGKAIPRQPITIPGTSFYEPEMAKHYLDYNPERANEFLDEMGLKWDKHHQYRLRPDGKSLAITIEYSAGGGPKKEIHELVKEYWEKVGVKVAIKQDERTFYRQRLRANAVDVGTWHYDQLSEFGMYRSPEAFLLPFRFGAQEWHNWYATDGKGGEEPPAYIKKLFQLVDEWRTTLPGTEKYTRLGKEFLTILSKNLVAIGTVGLAPAPLMAANNLRNFPQKAMLGGDWWFLRPYHAEQWFFKK